MTAPESAPTRPTRRWLRFSLRTLFLLVTLVAIGLGLWTQRVRWHVARLADPQTAQAAFDRIVELHAATLPPEVRDNVLAYREALRERATRRLSVWPQKPGSFLPGYVWVHEESALYAVSPLGETNLGGIVAYGPAQVLWNGTLPDGRPGIVLFNNVLDERGNDGYLMCVTTRRVPDPNETEMPTLRLMVQVTRPDVTAELVADAQTPTIVLRDAEGKHTETFDFPHGAFQEGAEKVKTNTPWRMQSRW